jgi:NADPH:quinone reductase-like Zn-dependent oxidoreductase
VHARHHAPLARRVAAFGLNHAEAYMRSGGLGEVAQVTGIECAGTVQADPSGRLAAGTAVVATLGGMGRTRNGSYAGLVTVSASNVVPVRRPAHWRPVQLLRQRVRARHRQFSAGGYPAAADDR